MTGWSDFISVSAVWTHTCAAPSHKMRLTWVALHQATDKPGGQIKAASHLRLTKKILQIVSNGYNRGPGVVGRPWQLYPLIPKRGMRDRAMAAARKACGRVDAPCIGQDTSLLNTGMRLALISYGTVNE